MLFKAWSACLALWALAGEIPTLADVTRLHGRHEQEKGSETNTDTYRHMHNDPWTSPICLSQRFVKGAVRMLLGDQRSLLLLCHPLRLRPLLRRFLGILLTLDGVRRQGVLDLREAQLGIHEHIGQPEGVRVPKGIAGKLSLGVKYILV